MKTKISTLFFAVLATGLFAQQPPSKIWTDDSDLKGNAVRNYTRGDYLECIVNCQKLVSQGAPEGFVYGLMAMAYDSLVNNEKAEKSRSEARTYKMDSSILKRLASADLSPAVYKRNFLMNGANYYNAGKYDLSELAFAHYLKLEPRDTFAIFFLANAQFYQGKINQALANYKRVLEIDFTRADIQNLAGICYMVLNNFLTARDYFAQATILDNTIEVAFYNLGRIHYGLQDKIAALEDLNRAFALNPKDSNCVAMLSQIYLEQQDFPNAEKYLARQYVFNKYNERVGWNLVSITLKNRHYEKAVGYLQNLIKVNPRNAEAYSRLGQTLISLNRYEEGLTNYETAIAKLGENRDNLYGAGLCANQIHQHEKAVAYLERATAIDLSFAGSFRELGTAYHDLHKNFLAQKNFRKANGIEQAQRAENAQQLQAKN